MKKKPAPCGADRLQLLAALLWFLITGVLLGLPARAENQPKRQFRVAFSSRMFVEVNENDVRAALKIWIQTVAREQGIPVDDDLVIFNSLQEFAESGGLEGLEGVALTMPEFPTLSRYLQCDRFALGVTKGQYTEEYLLLVHTNSAITSLAQLKGTTLRETRSPRLSMADIWLDLLLADRGLPRIRTMFSKLEHDSRADKVVLSVFFRQAEACLVTRSSFDMMCELNPQLRERLRILEASPPLVPAGFAFRTQGSMEFQNHLITATRSFNYSPSGRQMLMLTHSDTIEEFPVSCADDTLAMLRRHQSMFGAGAAQ